MGLFDSFKKQSNQSKKKKSKNVSKAVKGFIQPVEKSIKDIDNDFKELDKSITEGLLPKQTVVKEIKSWRPRKYTSEGEYQNSLMRHLKKSLQRDIGKEINVRKSKLRVDIQVGKNVVIEMKYNFKTRTQYRALKGQIEDYTPKKWGVKSGFFIAVLCGESRPDLVKEIKKDFRFKNYVEIIDK